MLRPTKHSHPDQTVVGVATILLDSLKKTRLSKYDALLAIARKRVSGGDVLFLPALNLLFVLGLVTYRSKTDAFEYSGAQ
ncbi:ABC-three component system middle component 8 [uncultured Microbacterium sp.]|uniref:ABC-three component system middle component 8 n=1 Tax=uncultured Microbacterium sp. TaxID=191216 RepID=UPI0028D83068|nr:ABC-three component system middle component 8 [uncultured Microbacterium sp.]